MSASQPSLCECVPQRSGCCLRCRRRRKRLRDPEKFRQQQRERAQRAYWRNPERAREKAREANKLWYWRNPERARQKARRQIHDPIKRSVVNRRQRLKRPRACKGCGAVMPPGQRRGKYAITAMMVHPELWADRGSGKHFCPKCEEMKLAAEQVVREAKMATRAFLKAQERERLCDCGKRAVPGKKKCAACRMRAWSQKYPEKRELHRFLYRARHPERVRELRSQRALIARRKRAARRRLADLNFAINALNSIQNNT